MGKMKKLKIKTKKGMRPAQRDSKMSNGRLSGVLCWPHGQEIKTSPAQQYSGISNLAIRPLCPYCPLCPLDLKTTTATKRKTLKSHKN